MSGVKGPYVEIRIRSRGSTFACVNASAGFLKQLITKNDFFKLKMQLQEGIQFLFRPEGKCEYLVTILLVCPHTEIIPF